MTIGSITTDTASQAGSDRTTLAGNFNTFLTLITSQLQNQDPLSPMDSTQFTQQLVQFSAVEQQINGNKKLDQLIGLQSTANAYGAVGFVGTTIAGGLGARASARADDERRRLGRARRENPRGEDP